MPYVTTLTESDLTLGKQIIDQLKAKGFLIDGAFWLYDEEADDWQLVIATKLVDQEGRQATYLRLGQIVSTERFDPRLFNISVMSPQTPLFVALRKTYGGVKNVEGVRLQHHFSQRCVDPCCLSLRNPLTEPVQPPGTCTHYLVASYSRSAGCRSSAA